MRPDLPHDAGPSSALSAPVVWLRRRLGASARPSDSPEIEAVRRALIVMTLGLAVTFPLARPPETSNWVTGSAVVVAVAVAVGLWRRWASVLTLLRWATFAAVVVMTWGIVDALDAVNRGVPLAVRFLAYSTILMTLALFVLGTRWGLALSAVTAGGWFVLIARHDVGADLVAPGGEVLVAARYALVLLVLLWGILQSREVLREERDRLARAASSERAERRHQHEDEEQRARVMAEVAHELRTPLATIEAGTEALGAHVGELDPVTLDRLLAAMRNAAVRLDHRAVELLETARDRVTSVPARRQEVDAGTVVAATVADLAPLTEHHHVRLDLAPCPARLDPDGLDHIVTNLVHNAVKYAPAGSAITIRVRREDATTVIVVADEGAGVPEDVRGELFTPWERAASHAAVDGTGVGLAVARTWARRHGGDVVLLDTEVGAAFEVRLPDQA